MELEISFEGAWPESAATTEIAEKCAEAVGAVAPELCNARLLVSLLFSDNAKVRALNREWRQRDKPTNVLSFPMLTRKELLDLAAAGPPILLGDVALAMETVVLEAHEKDVLLEQHLAHLIIHGLLHLAGYDHVHSDEEAEAMEALEIAALAKMGVSDPYGDRD